MKHPMLILFPGIFALVACGGNPASENKTPSTTSTPDISTNTYTITFHTNGGSPIEPLQVKEGDIATKPANPTKADSYFAGWFLDEWFVAEYYFEERVVSNLDLYAKWSSEPASSSGSGSIVPSEYVYTVEGMPGWIRNDDCVIFAWIWGKSTAGSWMGLTFASSTSATFTVTAELDGFLLVRCAAGTEEPDWGKTTETGPGRIFNQTNDIICISGVYAYECASWIDYPKAS